MPSEKKWKGIRFDQVIDAYLHSPKFLELRGSTQKLWERELLFAGRVIGNMSVEELRPAIIQEFMDGLAQWPGKQHVSLTALKAVCKWARVRDLLACEITFGIEIGEIGGHTPWSEEQVHLAETGARADIARVITLGSNTGQRGSDLVRMGWTDIENFQGRAGINVKQQKTGREIWCPINEALAKAMETWERRPGPFLLHQSGKPWRRPQLSEAWNNERDRNPSLRPLREAGLVLHGLRGHACVRLYRSGLTTREVSVLVGMSLDMVEQYCRLSVQKEDAIAAVIRLETHQNKVRLPWKVDDKAG